MMEGPFVLLTGLVGALVIRRPHQALAALLIVVLKLWLSSSFEVEVIYSAWASILLCVLSSRLLHWSLGLVLVAAQVNFLVRTWDTLDCTGLCERMWWAGLAVLLVSIICVWRAAVARTAEMEGLGLSPG
jgi:hypothetical protein